MIFWVLVYLVGYTKKLFYTTRHFQKNTFEKKGGSNLLGYYLAGLIEGDGSIILRKGEREKISPKIVFTFHHNEISLYNKLRQILHTGVIYKEKPMFVDILLVMLMQLLY